MNQEDINFYDKVINFKATVKYILSKWWAILIFALLGGGAGFLVAYLKKPVYVAKLSFVIEEEGAKQPGGLASLASSFGIGGGAEGLFNTSNIMDFLKMRSLVEKALLNPVNGHEKLTFAQLYINEYKLNKHELWRKNKKLKGITFLPNEDRSEFSLQKDSILGSIFKKIVTSKMLIVSQPNKENSIIQIELKNKNEIFTKYFPESLIGVVSEYYIENKTKKTKNNLIVLQRQVDSVRKELLTSMVGVAVSTDRVFGLNPAMNVKRIPSAQKQVDVQANTAILSELVKNLEVTKMSLLNQTPLIEIVDKPVLPLEIQKLSKLLAIIIGGVIGTFMIISFYVFKDYLHKQKEINSINKI